MLKLDSLDIKILCTIQHNARVTLAELSNTVNLSISALHKRVANLERRKVIKSYNTEINFSLFQNVNLIFVTIRLVNHQSSTSKKFENEIVLYDQIIECHALGGGIDYILKFFVKDIAEYENLIQSILQKDLQIAEYYTYIVTSEVKKTAPKIEPIN